MSSQLGQARFAMVLLVAMASIGPVAAQDDLAAALQKLDTRIYPAGSDDAKELQQQLGKWLRSQRDQVNRRDVQAWDAIRTKDDWEHFRDQKIDALRRSLGTFPTPPKEMKVHVAKTIQGDGFVIENLVYESRPDSWVTANLYRPAKPQARDGAHPGIVIIHSHHNPKSQGELQDMGMTWARAGCYVLIPDQLGHGERRQHPFVDAKSYPGNFKVGRQDYYFRYNVAMHLHLVGESLIGWMANDMMRGVDLLYTKPGIDKKAIILLGSVAGGGDPAAVTAALDPRITAVAPFNFGGPQPETKFPLPADSRLSFNYMGSGSWESTRNLRLSGRDGFLPWVIVGSVAPRALIHAHEFAWDKDRDPVWDRYRQIFKWYGAGDKLGFTKGAGAVTGSGPGNTHCNNIGVVHRKAIHPLLEKWFGIKAEEYSKRVPSEELQCLTPEVKAKIKLTPVHELAGRIAEERLAELHKETRGASAVKQREQIVKRWRSVLDGAPRLDHKIDFILRDDLPGKIKSHVLVLLLGPFRVPALVLEPPQLDQDLPVVVAIAQEGTQGFVKNRREELARLLKDGIKIVIPELPGCGQCAVAGDSRSRASSNTSQSATAQMLGTTLTRLQLMALRLVIHFEGRPDQTHPVVLWGDSFAPTNPADFRFQVPLDADKMPHQAEPLGPTLALLAGALYDTRIDAIYLRGGLVNFRSMLDNQFLYAPHDAVIPGALLAGDLDDLAAAYLSRKGTRLAIEAPVDGLNRMVGRAALESSHPLATKASGKDTARLRLSRELSSPAEMAAWMQSTSK
jgi:dienelactone hydrolase